MDDQSLWYFCVKLLFDELCSTTYANLSEEFEEVCQCFVMYKYLKNKKLS